MLLHGDRLERHVAPSAARELERERRRDPEAAQHLGADHEVGDPVEDGPVVVPCDQRADASLHLPRQGRRRSPQPGRRRALGLRPGPRRAPRGTGTAGAGRRSGRWPGIGLNGWIPLWPSRSPSIASSRITPTICWSRVKVGARLARSSAARWKSSRETAWYGFGWRCSSSSTRFADLRRRVRGRTRRAGGQDGQRADDRCDSPERHSPYRTITPRRSES